MSEGREFPRSRAPLSERSAMNPLDGVTRTDQHRALGLSTLAFTVCFAVWTIFSIIGVQIKQQLGLSDTQFGLLVATPVLTGSVSRIFLGVWTEQYGGRILFQWHSSRAFCFVAHRVHWTNVLRLFVFSPLLVR